MVWPPVLNYPAIVSNVCDKLPWCNERLCDTLLHCPGERGVSDLFRRVNRLRTYVGKDFLLLQEWVCLVSQLFSFFVGFSTPSPIHILAFRVKLWARARVHGPIRVVSRHLSSYIPRVILWYADKIRGIQPRRWITVTQVDRVEKL